MRNLSKEEISNLGMYEFQAYIGAMTSPTFGGWKGTNRLIEGLKLSWKGESRVIEPFSTLTL